LCARASIGRVNKVSLHRHAYNVEGVNVLDKSALDEWMAPYPLTFYVSNKNPISYGHKLERYLGKTNKMVLRGVWDSITNKELLEVTYAAFPKDLIVRHLRVRLMMMRSDDANDVPTIQGKDILNRWCDLAYIIVGFSTYHILYCNRSIYHYIYTVDLPHEMWSAGMRGYFDFECRYKMFLTCKQFYGSKGKLVTDAFGANLNKVFDSHN